MPEEVKPVEVEKPAETEVIEVAKEEKKDDEAAAQLGQDELEDRIALKVYDKIKGFVTELTTAANDVEKLVSESVAAKSEEVAPVEEEVEDVKPVRSHKLFARRGKRE